MTIPNNNNGGKFFLDENENLKSASKQIAQEATSFFLCMFNSDVNEQFLNIVCKKILIGNSREDLHRPFQLKEVK